MNFDFTDDIRSTFARARSESDRLSHKSVGAEHLLLAIFQRPTVPVARLLSLLNVAPADLITMIEQRFSPSNGPRVVGELPYSLEGNKAIEAAMSEARSAGVNRVDQGHLLLGILNCSTDKVANVLRESGMELEESRRVLMQADEVRDA